MAYPLFKLNSTTLRGWDTQKKHSRQGRRLRQNPKKGRALDLFILIRGSIIIFIGRGGKVRIGGADPVLFRVLMPKRVPDCNPSRTFL